MSKKIIVKVPLRGDLEIETKGFAGKACIDATKSLETVGDKISDVKTSDFYKAETKSQAENKA